jgi:hypothetical protein
MTQSGHDAGFRFTEGVFDGQFKVHRNGATVVPRFVLIKKSVCQDMLYERSRGHLAWAKSPG